MIVIVTQFINNDGSFLFVDKNNNEDGAKEMKESIARDIFHKHQEDQILIQNDRTAVVTMKKFGPIKVEIKDGLYI